MDVCTIIAKNYAPQARVLGRSLAEFHPSVRFHVLVVDEVEGYIDAPREPFDIVDPQTIGLPDFERMAGIYDLLELSTAVKPWLLAALLDRGADGIVYLDPDMRLYAPIDDVFTAVSEHSLVLSPHNLDPMPRDGRRPNEQDILIAGAYNLGFIGLARGETADRLLSWWSERLETDCIVDPSRGFFVDQRWIDFVPSMVDDFHLVRDRGFNVAYWNLPTREITRDSATGGWLAGGSELRLFHFSGFDARKPHQLSKHQDRIELSSHPELAELCRGYADELLAAGGDDAAGWPYTFSTSASGMPVNRTVRQLYRRAVIDEDLNFDLFDPEAERAFLDWLNAPGDVGGDHGTTRYLEALWNQRADLQRAYPRLDDPDDAAGFLGWSRVFAVDEVPPALTPPERDGDPDGPSASRPTSAVRPPAGPHRQFGVNVVGYLHAELGVGEVARQAIGALDHQRIPVLPVALPAPQSRHGHALAAVPLPERAFPVNLLCVNADMLPALAADLGPDFFAGRRTIGWWWWEVDRFPERWLSSFEHVDEIWTGSSFVQQALAAVSPVPVVRVPVPVRLPPVPPAGRDALGLPDDALFAFIFDHHSVFERKNPLGVIDAFLRAFPDPGEATLVVKSINGEHHRDDRERLRTAAAGHPHVRLIEDYLSPDLKNVLVANCDAYVSLHRSEGFGMTMAEAMLLGKPVIATGYSGNLDFMDPENSLLVRHDLRPVGPGADPYPADATWAEPDLEHAAELMRAVVEEPERMRAIGARAHTDVDASHGLAAAGTAMQTRLAAIRSQLPPRGHDYIWAAGEHVQEARRLLDAGPLPPGGRGRRIRRGLRRAVLRLMRPHTVHQGRVDQEVAVALGDIATELATMRDAGDRALAVEALAFRELRDADLRSHSRLTEAVGGVHKRIDDLTEAVGGVDRRVDDLTQRLERLHTALHRQGLVSIEGDVPPAGYVPAPPTPWSHEYNDAHRAFVSAELEDPARLDYVRRNRRLPGGFGRGFDERVVEFPWVAGADLAGAVLDAGSALNHRHVLSRLRPRVDALHIVTLAPEDEAHFGMGVSYVYADLRDLPMRDATYDVVVCISTLEHIGMDNSRFGAGGARAADDPQREAARAVDELWRVLKPGGRLLLTAPVGRGERAGWVRSLTVDELEELIGRCDAVKVERAFFKHADGWSKSSADEVREARYRDHLTAGPPVEGVVAAEAVACVELAKPPAA